MIPRRLTLATVTGLTAALALAGCGGSKGENAQKASADRQAPRAVSDGLGQGASDGYGSTEGGYGTGGAAAGQAAGKVTTALKAKKTATMGTIVTDDANWTLYRFDQDKANPSKSTCAGACAAKWPPILAKDLPRLQGIDRKLVGSVVRADGKEQVTINKWPVYRFAADKKAGVWKGHGVGGTWWAITPEGAKAQKCLPGMASAANAWLKAKKTKAVGTIVVDGRGMTLYRFDLDKVNPSKSVCTGDCLKKWPALKWPGQKPQLAGIDARLVGKVRRDDGSWQVTLAGWPMYHFFKDQKPGDWKGIGVGGTWWAFQTNGKKAQKCMPGMTQEETNARLNNGGGDGGYSSGGGSGNSGGGGGGGGGY